MIPFSQSPGLLIKGSKQYHILMPSNNKTHRLSLGAQVVDREKEGTPGLVVIDLPDATCEEWEVPGTGQTVADFNQDYDPSAPVVVAVYQHELEDGYSGWRGFSEEDFQLVVEDDDIRQYAYPAPRLRSATGELPDDIDTYYKLICYQWARLIALAAGKYNEQFVRHKYKQIAGCRIQMSSLEKEQKYQLKEGFGECIYCGKECDTQFDHLIPVSNGGEDTVSNQVPACPTCNQSKGAKNVIEWFKDEHDGQVPRLVFGKYLKHRRKQLREEDRIHDDLPDEIRERWTGVEVTRNLSTRLHTRNRDR